MSSTWSDVLKEEKEKEYFKKVFAFQEGERRKGKNIYPAKENIFNAFKLTTFDSVKVVILGQDPYHGAGQAEGLCFSVPVGISPPPSLKNIFKELESDLSNPKNILENGFHIPKHGHLAHWHNKEYFC
jgi:uracil-DNA glycosylase